MKKFKFGDRTIELPSKDRDGIDFYHYTRPLRYREGAKFSVEVYDNHFSTMDEFYKTFDTIEEAIDYCEELWTHRNELIYTEPKGVGVVQITFRKPESKYDRLGIYGRTIGSFGCCP